MKTFFNEDIFNAYHSFKHPGNKGQQEKALRMLQSRKIVSVKTLRDNSGIYIRGMIKKSCGTTLGRKGLKHYTDTKEKILELTCTQKLQKWHHRSKKGSIPVVSLNEIKPKSDFKIPRNSLFTWLTRQI